MENSDFIIKQGTEKNESILVKYVGPGGDVVIPDTITAIEDRAFYECKNITSIRLPENLVQIGHEAFRGCSSLTSVYIPDNVWWMGYRVFSDCCNLEKVRIPKREVLDYNAGMSVKREYLDINVGMFENCSKLSSVASCPLEDMTEGVVLLTDYQLDHIGEKAFFNTNIEKVIFSKKVARVEVGVGAFSECKNLKSVTLPNQLEVIQKDAFNGCKALSEINWPSQLRFIGNKAFYHCKQLPSLSAPETLKNIKDDAFFGVDSMEDLMSREFSVNNGILFAYHGTSNEVIVPDGVISIIKEGLATKEPLQKVTLPDTVKNIDADAFLFIQDPSLSPKKMNELREKALPKEINLPKGYLRQKKGSYDEELVALLLGGPWREFATVEDYVAMYLTQSRKAVLDICKEYLSKRFPHSFENLLNGLETYNGVSSCCQAAILAVENKTNLTPHQLHRLYVIAEAKKSKKALQLLEAYKDAPEGAEEPISALAPDIKEEIKPKKVITPTTIKVQYSEIALEDLNGKNALLLCGDHVAEASAIVKKYGGTVKRDISNKVQYIITTSPTINPDNKTKTEVVCYVLDEDNSGKMPLFVSFQQLKDAARLAYWKSKQDETVEEKVARAKKIFDACISEMEIEIHCDRGYSLPVSESDDSTFLVSAGGCNVSAEGVGQFFDFVAERFEREKGCDETLYKSGPELRNVLQTSFNNYMKTRWRNEDTAGLYVPVALMVAAFVFVDSNAEFDVHFTRDKYERRGDYRSPKHIALRLSALFENGQVYWKTFKPWDF